MLAQSGALPVDSSRGFRELGHYTGHLDPGTAGQLGIEQHAAGLVMRVGHNVGHRVDAPGRHLGSFQRGQHRFDRVVRSPFGDGGIEQLALPGAAVVLGKLGSLGQIHSADGTHQPFENRVAVTGNHHKGAVGRRVGIGRGDPRQGATGALTHGPEQVIFGHQAFHQVEHAFHQRYIHHLPFTLPCLDPQQRHQRTDYRMHRRQRIAQADTDPCWCRFRGAGGVADAAHGLANGAEARAVTVGAGLAVAGDTHQGQFGVQGVQYIPAQAEFLKGTGAQVLDQYVSAFQQLFDDGDALG
ncbi:hypothetical protein D9M71_200880 [compost metagenome]